MSVGGNSQRREDVKSIDCYKIIFEDGSWLTICPSGTESKVKFYLEPRTAAGTKDLVEPARGLLVVMCLL